MRQIYISLSVTGIFVFLVTVSNSQEIKPANGAILSYTHVLFQWPQLPEASSYQLQIALNDTSSEVDPFNSFLIADKTDTSLLLIITNGLAWDQEYIWRLRAIDTESVPGEWGERITFSIAPLPEAVPQMVTTMFDSARYYAGITFIDIDKTGIVLAIDRFGQPVWFASQGPLIAGRTRLTYILPNGHFLATAYNSPHGSAYVFTVDNELIWEAPYGQESKIHHDIFPMPNGNYMAITNVEKWGPIPPGPWVTEFQNAGMDSVIWRGDELIEWDKDGNEIWRWNVIDHFYMADYDSATFSRAFDNGFHDWTHCNAVFYDPIDRAVYLSARQLSRITKIDYVTGNIIWNMGRVMPSGSVRVGNDLRFSYQHAIKVLNNGNLMLYDNGNQSNPQVSRGIEIAITEADSFPTAHIVWEYILPDSLYTPARGDCDRLPNGNSLLTAAFPSSPGRHSVVLEVAPDSTEVWRMQLGDGGGRLLYRSERVPGLYPHAFSIVQPRFEADYAVPTIEIPVGDNTLEYRIYNEGWRDETFHYVLSDNFGWFNASGTVFANAGTAEIISISGTVDHQSVADTLKLIIVPEHAPEHTDTLRLLAISQILSADAENASPPFSFELHSAYPNPFNPATTIRFDLPEAAAVRLVVYDLQGREVATLVAWDRRAGYHSVVWDGKAAIGGEAPSGIYIARLVTPQYTKSIKLLLLK